ncbi:hypothetical protein DENSPDRAFT_409245 [Dentipellis sp. KUC8613]|nr:hypothetical protein DENSPDRAFT_409245 [Dentipellis sp. KUC8613]
MRQLGIFRVACGISVITSTYCTHSWAVSFGTGLCARARVQYEGRKVAVSHFACHCHCHPAGTMGVLFGETHGSEMRGRVDGRLAACSVGFRANDCWTGEMRSPWTGACDEVHQLQPQLQTDRGELGYRTACTRWRCQWLMEARDAGRRGVL